MLESPNLPETTRVPGLVWHEAFPTFPDELFLDLYDIYGPWWSWMLQNRWPCTMLPATKPHTKYWGGPLQPYKFLACFSDHWFWCPQKALPCASLGLMLGAMWGRCGDASPRTLPLCGHLCVLGLAGLRVGSPGWDGYMAHKPRLWAAWCREGVACGL